MGPLKKKDAIHVPIARVRAGAVVTPGDHVVMIDGRAWCQHHSRAKGKQIAGIVDPFDDRVHILRDQEFWVWLAPGSTQDLRHEWSHPDFPDENVKIVEKIVEVEKPVYNDDYEDSCRGCY